MSWSVRWTKPAIKDILGIPKKQRLMILAWVEENLNDGSIEIEVVRVGHRQGVYNNLPKL